MFVKRDWWMFVNVRRLDMKILTFDPVFAKKLRLMFLILGSCTMNSSLKVHWKTSDEALLRYCGTQTVTAFKLLFNYYTQPRWLLTAGQVRRHAQLKHVNLLNYSSLSPRANFTLISFLLYKKKKKKICVPEVKQVPEVPQAPRSTDL